MDLERQLRKSTLSVYPNSLGITGEVFKSQEIVWSNNIKQLSQYVAGLDNQTKFIKDVRSILITPVFGHTINGK
jgi:hypothetical protein